MLQIEEVREASGLEVYRQEWSELAQRVPGSDVFQTFEWLGPWLASFWPGRPLRFLFVRDNGRLIALAPLLLDIDGVLGCSNSLILPVNSHARRSDLLIDGEARPVLDALITHLRREDPRMRVMFRSSLSTSRVGAALGGAARPRFMAAAQVPGTESPIIRIDADWDSFLATRPAHTRSELKRKVRKLERDFKSSWSVVTSLDQCEPALEQVFAIEERSWKEDEGTSFTAENGLEDFYRGLARSFASAGWFRLYLLQLDGKPVAHIFGAEFKQEYFAFKTSYDEQFKAASPGVVLFQYALRECFDRKLLAFDFLGERSRWKNELANDARHHSSTCLFSLTNAECCLCSASEVGLKPLLRKTPAGLAAAMRKMVAAVRAPATEPGRKERPAEPLGAKAEGDQRTP